MATPSADPDAHAGLLATSAASCLLQFLVFKALTAADAMGSSRCPSPHSGNMAGLGPAFATAFCPHGRLAGIGSFSAAAFSSPMDLHT